MPRQNNQSRKQKGTVAVPAAEYKKLISRPKQSTLARDAGQRGIRKGKLNNPYVQTLFDPVKVTGVKVPDVTSFPTSTVQIYERYDQVVNASTDFAVCVQPMWQDFQSVCPNLNGSTAYANWSPVSQASALNGIYHSMRVVSGCMRIWTNASSTSNSGELAVALLPQEQGLSTAEMGTFDLIAKRFGASRAALKEGFEILWMPQDAKSREFTLANFSWLNQQIGTNAPALIAAVTGAVGGTTISFEHYWNFECVPEQSTMNLVNASAPYVSSKDLEQATGIFTKMGSFARPLGEDLGSWLLDQGALAAGEIVRGLGGAAVHYTFNRLGLKGGYSAGSVIS